MRVEIPVDWCTEECWGRVLKLGDRREERQQASWATEEAVERYEFGDATICHCNSIHASVVCKNCAYTCLALLSTYLWGLSYDQHLFTQIYF